MVNDLGEVRDGEDTIGPSRTGVARETRALPGTRRRNLFEQLLQILKHGVFFVRLRAIGEEEFLAQVQCLSLHETVSHSRSARR
jgi:hypothetical protein